MSQFYRNRETELRKGRYSLAGGRYFITLCTENRKCGLTHDAIGNSIIQALRQLQSSDAINLHCATIMPDHVHLLYTLGSALKLSQIQAKLKFLTKPALAEVELKWQPNFYDHHLRTDTFLEKFAYYIFLNPYRKGIIGANAEWPWWILNRQYHPEFIDALRDGKLPQPEWLQSYQHENIKTLIESDR